MVGDFMACTNNHLAKRAVRAPWFGGIGFPPHSLDRRGTPSAWPIDAEYRAQQVSEPDSQRDLPGQCVGC